MIDSIAVAAQKLLWLIPNNLIALLARFAVGLTFFKSGLTKLEGASVIDKLTGFDIAAKTYFLFENIYRVPLLSPEVATRMATTAEIVCPILLWIGFLGRFSATALLIMVIVIQLFVKVDAYHDHAFWAVCLLFIMKYGPGVFSIDYFIHRDLARTN